MYLAIASDHFGYPLKAVIVEHLKGKQVEFEDLGVFSEEEVVDYPRYCFEALPGDQRGKIPVWNSHLRNRYRYGHGGQ